jgi:hypothetical protein
VRFEVLTTVSKTRWRPASRTNILNVKIVQSTDHEKIPARNSLNVEWLTILLSIWEFLGSSLGPCHPD